MPLTVHYMCAYYSMKHAADEAATNDSWHSIKFCKAVKERTINGYLVVPYPPPQKPFRIDTTNVIAARQIFGQFLRLVTGDTFKDTIFVPVPSKDSWNTADFRSLVMLREALGNDHQKAVPLLKFTEQRPRASEGGPRGYAATRPYLTVSGPIPPARIVLVDDIVTSGGSVIASRDALVDAGGAVDLAVVCGKTVGTQEFTFDLRSLVVPDGHCSID